MKHKALRTIHDEHQIMGALLQALRLLAERLHADAHETDFDLVRAILFYLDEYPSRRHHLQEDDVIYARLRERAPQAREVLARLEAEHARMETAVRDLQQLLLAFELLGEPRHKAFSDALEHYIESQARHMQIEEQEVLPLADSMLSEADWVMIDAAFEERPDPATGRTPSQEYQKLYEKILEHAPAPLGLG